jgi:hypothetical protein
MFESARAGDGDPYWRDAARHEDQGSLEAQYPGDGGRDGPVKTGIQPEVILVTNTDHFDLDKTMSKKDLTEGTYLMNIVYGGQTERVLFSVK